MLTKSIIQGLGCIIISTLVSYTIGVLFNQDLESTKQVTMLLAGFFAGYIMRDYFAVKEKADKTEVK